MANKYEVIYQSPDGVKSIVMYADNKTQVDRKFKDRYFRKIHKITYKRIIEIRLYRG